MRCCSSATRLEVSGLYRHKGLRMVMLALQLLGLVLRRCEEIHVTHFGRFGGLPRLG
jgi:hypothetical protein